jgi:RNA polymerase sigma-70 factor (ECF subfamily)
VKATASIRPLARPGAGPTDEALVLAARAGDPWAFEALFRRHVRMAAGLAHRLLPKDSEVDDIVQDCFSTAFERLDSLQSPPAFGSWLGSIVIRTVHKRLRRRRLLERLGMRSPDPIEPDEVVSRSAPPEVAAELRAVYAFVISLPAEQRVALLLRRVEGLEVSQIASQMGVSVSTVKRRLKSAEAALERAHGN